jgi:hypothetical protein
MARTRNEKPPKKVEIGFPPDEFACLEALKKIGGYGSNPTEVARYLIRRELDDLRRAGVLPVMLPAFSANTPSTDGKPDEPPPRA